MPDTFGYFYNLPGEKKMLVTPTVQQLFPCEVGEREVLFKIIFSLTPATTEQAATRQKTAL